MSNGAFRDASAALERAAALEQENAELRAELDAMRGVASEAERELKGETLTSVRAELKATLKKLETASRDLHAMRENYRVLRHERDGSEEEANRQKARADGAEVQLRSLHKLTKKEHTLQVEAERAEKALSLTQANLASREHALEKARAEITQLRHLLEETRTQQEERVARMRVDLPENHQAFFSRLEEERQELLVEVKELRAKLEAKPEPSLLDSLLGRR